MAIIAKWALQAVALFLFAWMASVAAHWNSTMINGSGSDRLAQLNESALLSTAVSSKHAVAQDTAFVSQGE
ncbi:hypothetical protein ALQ04_03883 [Pseudomonas cichorii]|uniref:Uncharacterized protein n=1 Tax=Pseudomonas cichorii TaxID=36746 RepID=A0A3M4M2D5_PSECI|nr:hypothetical protein [Pseudomonas cichorii]RMQ47444.1 hypothetical protein ALQ04_03883 [Pseudomonas cichorii]